MHRVLSAHRHIRESVAAMENDSREYIRAFCISVAIVMTAAALPSFIL